jgi:hypothetical protein
VGAELARQYEEVGKAMEFVDAADDAPDLDVD